jgi:gliding motility-associated protein GldC
MSKEIVKTSEITLQVGLNAENMPVKIEWKASDAADGAMQECKALAIALFDKTNRDTLRIDLWTTDFQVNEMDRFMYHLLKSLGDTYFRATQNRDLANDLQKFAQHFGELTEILPKK